MSSTLIAAVFICFSGTGHAGWGTPRKAAWVVSSRIRRSSSRRFSQLTPFAVGVVVVVHGDLLRKCPLGGGLVGRMGLGAGAKNLPMPRTDVGGKEQRPARWVQVPPGVPEAPLLLSVRDAPGGSGLVLRRQVVDALREHLLQAAELASQLEAAVRDGQEAAGQDQVNH